MSNNWPVSSYIHVNFNIVFILIQQLDVRRLTQVGKKKVGRKELTACCSIIHEHLSHSAVYFNWPRPLSVLQGPRWHPLPLGP